MTDKHVTSYEKYQQGQAPRPTHYIDIKTADGWRYRLYALCKGDPFELKHKRRPDGSISEDEYVPAPVVGYVEECGHEVVAPTVAQSESSSR